METKVLVGLILVIISGFVLAMWLSGAIGFLYASSDKEVCKTSVLAKWGAKKASVGAASDLFNLNCKTQIVKITKNEIIKNGKKVEDLKGLKGETDEEKIKRAIANEMYDCWYQFNRGQFDFTQLFIGASRNICIVCAEISFDESVRREIPQIRNFAKWVSENRPEGGEDTYYEYLTNRQGNIKEDLKDLEIHSADFINTRESHQVLFLVEKSTTTGSFVTVTGICTAVGAVVGGVVGFFGGFGIGAIPAAIAGAKIGGTIGVAAGAVTGITYADAYVPAVLFLPTEAIPEYCNKYY